LRSYYGRDGRELRQVCSKSPANKYPDEREIPLPKMSHVRLVKNDASNPGSPRVSAECGILLGNYSKDQSRQTIQPNGSLAPA
jgi:hypothetical protein